MLSADEIPLDVLLDSRILHVGSISLTDEPCREATLYAMKKAKENGIVISYDPNYRASLWCSEEEAIRQMRSIIPYADVMKISEEETRLLTGESDCERAAQSLIEHGVKIAAVTLGKAGAYVRTAEGGKIVKGFKNNAVDATGAGDAFWGGFLYSFSQSGKSPDTVALDEAAGFADFGNAVASVCVEEYGAIPAMPTFEQVAGKLKEERRA